MSDFFVAFLVMLVIATVGTFGTESGVAFASGCDRYFGVSVCW